MTERRTLADRLAGAGILPHHLEAAGLTVVLCELIDELIEATNRQTALLAGRLAEPTKPRQGQKPDATAPGRKPARDDQEGDQVQLREPELPPDDPDGEPAPPTPARAKPAAGKSGARTPTAKTPPAAKTPAVKPSSPRRAGRGKDSTR